MSLLNNAVVPSAVVGLYGLAFVLGVGHYSQEQTAAHLRLIEQHRAEAEAIRRSEETTRLQVLNARVAAAMKEATQAAVLAALPGDPAKGEMTYMPCDTCHFMQAEGSAYSMRRV